MRKRILALLIASTVAIVSVTVGCSKKTTTNTNIEETSPSDVTTPEEETTASTEGTTTEAEGEVSTEDKTTSDEENEASTEDVTTDEGDVTTSSEKETSKENVTAKPTVAPTEKPTQTPPTKPTVAPTVAPTKPVTKPTAAPTVKPTVAPTKPVTKPTVAPTQPTTVAPTQAPAKPTVAPTTAAPVEGPTHVPTQPTTAPIKEPESHSIPSHWKKVQVYYESRECSLNYYTDGTWVFEYTGDPLNKLYRDSITDKNYSYLTVNYKNLFYGGRPVEKEVIFLVKYVGNEENLEIPKTIDGIDVLGLDSDFCERSQVIKTLTIPETIVEGGISLVDTNITKVVVKGTKWRPGLTATGLNSKIGTVIYCEKEVYEFLMTRASTATCEAVFKSLDGNVTYRDGSNILKVYPELHNCNLPLRECQCNI